METDARAKMLSIAHLRLFGKEVEIVGAIGVATDGAHPPTVDHLSGVQDSSFHASTSSVRVSDNSCGKTLVPAMTGMKLTSPPHLGTTC